MGGEPARNRGAGTRCKGRIKAIDVESEIGLLLAYGTRYLLRDLGRTHLVNPVRIEDVEAESPLPVEGRADANLNRALGIDEPVSHRMVEHRAVIDSVTVIGLHVAMGIKMDESQRTMQLGMRFQQ